MAFFQAAELMLFHSQSIAPWGQCASLNISNPGACSEKIMKNFADCTAKIILSKKHVPPSLDAQTINSKSYISLTNSRFSGHFQEQTWDHKNKFKQEKSGNLDFQARRKWKVNCALWSLGLAVPYQSLSFVLFALQLKKT